MRRLQIQLHHNGSDRQHGQGVVELALVLPILVLLVAGIVDLTNGYQTYVSLTNAAREGASYGMNYPNDTTGICSHVQQALPSTISVACGNVNRIFPAVMGDADCPGGSAKVSCPIRVTVTYALSTWLGSVLGFNTITLSPSIDMMVLGTG